MNPAAVQRILRHSDPKITTEVYGHLAPGDLRAEVDRLAFGLAEVAPAEEPVRVAAGADPVPFAAPLLHGGRAGNDKAGTPPDSGAIPASWMAGCRGLEPLASGVTVHASRRVMARRASQALGMIREKGARVGDALVGNARFRRRLGTPLVRQADVEIGRIIPLTVREVANALSVNRATVYSGIAKGTIPHVRLGHTLRIPVRPVE
ncbi:MAG TPA: excisionase family DNA-binding protein [Gemmatimonadales bacterium]|nr:excisionase family DNA-binding protein [Gemmatimonadales bacterium]